MVFPVAPVRPARAAASRVVNTAARLTPPLPPHGRASVALRGTERDPTRVPGRVSRPVSRSPSAPLWPPRAPVSLGSLLTRFVTSLRTTAEEKGARARVRPVEGRPGVGAALIDKMR